MFTSGSKSVTMEPSPRPTLGIKAEREGLIAPVNCVSSSNSNGTRTVVMMMIGVASEKFSDRVVSVLNGRPISITLNKRDVLC
jgi:hypothetical protein